MLHLPPSCCSLLITQRSRSAYAWKSNQVITYVCNWGYGTGNCWASEVASMIMMVENTCGGSSNVDAEYSGWYMLEDWGLGVGIGPLGGDSCPGLGGNWDGNSANPS